ncbi:MAG: MFS transporter [Alphaproteobacteria bacterium]|nr:MFS transporter [Alphaproteobacteria bacterium]
MTISTASDARSRRNVTVLMIAQATIGSQLAMIFVLGGLAGQSLASNVCWATLPISMIVFGSMTTAPWMSHVMQKFGRRTGFLVGVSGGAIGAAIAAYALSVSSFPLFLLGSYFTGIYMSAHGFYRFAAVDTASKEFSPKAMSYVMAGGLAAAFIGPQMTIFTTDAMTVPFLGTYVAVVIINVVGGFLFLFLDIPTPKKHPQHTSGGRSRWGMLKSPRIAVAIIAAMVSYALMNLIMTSAPLAIVGSGHPQSAAAHVVTGHVLAMFIPSFFTGHLIVRFGVEKIISLGLIILASAGVVGLMGVDIMGFYGALILLGIGWNFGFIGASTMLTAAHTDQERGSIQGINDMIVFGFVTLGSLSSGVLMNCSGSNVVAGWSAVNLAMVPFLALAGGALIWLAMRPKTSIESV